MQVVKKKRKRILTRILNPDEKEIHTEIDIIISRLFSIFKTHVGREDAINSYDLFNEIYHRYPDELDVFERAYLWNVLKVILTRLRSREELFIVNNGSEYYVLKTEEECKIFKDKVDRTIKSLEDVKSKANTWVSKKSWRKII